MDDLTAIDELVDEQPVVERWRLRWVVSCRRWRDGGGAIDGEPPERNRRRRERGLEQAVREEMKRRERSGVSGEGINGACSRKDAVSPATSPACHACAPPDLAPWARSIRPCLSGLARDCFEKHADHNVEALRATKRAEIFSPGATQLLCELPNTPPMNVQTYHVPMNTYELQDRSKNPEPWLPLQGVLFCTCLRDGVRSFHFEKLAFP